MLVIVAALGAALAWGIAAGFDNRSTRLIGSLQALAWVQVIGLAEVVPFAVWEGDPSQPSPGAWGWIVVGGGRHHRRAHVRVCRHRRAVRSRSSRR